MGEIHKITKDGVTIFPATTTDAVVHPQARTSLTNLINSYNVSALFPTSGNSNTSEYTLQGAISLLANKLTDPQKISGIKVVFNDIINHETQEWKFLGGEFTNPSCWSREDYWYSYTSEELDNLEDNLRRDALRKTEQLLTEEEKNQVKKNLDLQLNAVMLEWDTECDMNLLTQPGIYSFSGTRLNKNDNLPIEEININISGSVSVLNDTDHIAQTLTVSSNRSVHSFSRYYIKNLGKWSEWSKTIQEINLGTIALRDLNNLKTDGIYVARIEENTIKIHIIVNNSIILQTLYFTDKNPKLRRFIDNEWSEFDSYITESSLTDIKTDISDLKELTETLQFKTSDDFCVASWDSEDIKPECDKVFGNIDFCDQWEFYLFDTTATEENGAIKPVGKLMRNNLLKFEDGSWAPTVGISESRRAECDVNLYFENGTQYSNAGDFDASEFYSNYGIDTKLYNSAKKEVNILRPWETVETKYTIGVGREKTIYLLDNIKGDSGKYWKGIFSKPVVWDGIDISKFELKPTAISPGACTVIRDNDGLDKARNFFYTYNGNSSCKGIKGPTGCTLLYSNNRSYPVSHDYEDANGYKTNQIKAMIWSRNNNENPTSPVPFAEGGMFSINSYITSYEVYYKTKCLHDNSLFTNGATNSVCNSETSWKTNGGVRIRVKDSGNSWEYSSWLENIKQKGYYSRPSIENETTSWSTLINRTGPKEACMESQMAMSYANEIGIKEGEEFNFYGYTYWYKNVPNTKLSALNNIVYKRQAGTVNVYNSEGEETTLDIEIVLRVGLINGVNLIGDCFIHYGGGYELVGTNIPNINPESKPDLSGYPIKIYLEPNQQNWIYSTEVRKGNYSTFDFEETYTQIIEDQINQTDGYCLKRIPYTNFSVEKGGSALNGECLYTWSGNSWSYKNDEVGNRVRIANLLRNSMYANYGIRSGSIKRAIDYTNPSSSISLQIRIKENYPLNNNK